jgi:acetyl esterase/lipase
MQKSGGKFKMDVSGRQHKAFLQFRSTTKLFSNKKSAASKQASNTMPPCRVSNNKLSTNNNNNDEDIVAEKDPLVEEEAVVVTNGHHSTTKTRIVRRPGEPVYVRCDSSEEFVNPIPTLGINNTTDQQDHRTTTACTGTTTTTTAADVNETLNLNLGQTIFVPENQTLIRILHFLNDFLFAWWERYLFRFWNWIPVHVRRRITYVAWNTIYYPLHKRILGRKTAIHPDASPEYHALTTILWIGRLFPVTVQRMRFSLAQLTASHAHPVRAILEEWGDDTNNNNKKNHDVLEGIKVPEVQKEHCRVRGIFMHHPDHYQNDGSTEKDYYTLFWLYGGAFLAGDAPGNLGPADAIAGPAGLDAFLPTYRLAPEANIHDVLWDVCLAYRYLVHWKIRHGQDPSRIILCGCSSGAALCARLMQFLAELERNEPVLPEYVAPLLRNLPMPKAAVLMSPYVDYSRHKPRDGSFFQYARHDLIVNQPVLRAGLPYLDSHMCGNRDAHGPLHRSLVGLPPLCVLVSEHETVYDETCAFVNKARRSGVPVTVGMWKYMCHVWSFFGGFVPEGKQSMEFIVEWIKERIEKEEEEKLPFETSNSVQQHGTDTKS